MAEEREASLRAVKVQAEWDAELRDVKETAAKELEDMQAKRLAEFLDLSQAYEFVKGDTLHESGHSQGTVRAQSEHS